MAVYGGAATAAACGRALRLGIRSPAGARLLCPNPLQRRPISELVKSNGKRLFFFDTLALVRRLEAEGLPPKHAEAITAAVTDVLHDSLQSVSHSFVSKAEMQKIVMAGESNLARLTTEVNSSQRSFVSPLMSPAFPKENHVSLLQYEMEKVKTTIDNIRSELSYEIDKLTAGQRLDLNLERGRIRDELKNQNQETTNLTNKLDREIHALRTHIEAAKYDVIKYCVGTLVSVSAVGLAVLRIVM